MKTVKRIIAIVLFIVVTICGIPAYLIVQTILTPTGAQVAPNFSNLTESFKIFGFTHPVESLIVVIVGMVIYAALFLFSFCLLAFTDQSVYVSDDVERVKMNWRGFRGPW